ncbi:MAG TPA: KpsF/GutQ family sugar-phosphate isomerase [Planctomycetaceae bacterium]|nr:KpsF/GutQ family sugar-phosphate isomerase [Planctomycetaceae bacterium]
MLQESAAIERAAKLLSGDFEKAVDLILNCTGNVIVSGVGKSGLIGAKLSATLASTGTPSHFIHAAEAMHGDLGRLRRGDIAVLLSNSGNTDEVISLAAVLRQDEVAMIAITGNKNSALGRLSSAVLNLGRTEEACPYNLAPTASTAAMLAIGDALALCVSNARSFTAQDFHKYHPGGALGKRMLPIRDVLRFLVGKNTAIVTEDKTVRQMLEIAEQYPRRCGAVLITRDNGTLSGIITDSDLRRLIVQHGLTTLDSRVEQVMTVNPIHALSYDLVKDVLQVIREHRLDEVPVVDDSGYPIGVLDVQDLIALKVIDE